jgi:hypothetical protein
MDASLMTTCSLDVPGCRRSDPVEWPKHLGRFNNEERCMTEKLSSKEVLLAWEFDNA